MGLCVFFIYILVMQKMDYRSQGQGVHSRILSYGAGNQRVVLKMVSSINTKECQLLKNQYKVLEMLRHPHILQAFKLKQIGGSVGNGQINQLRHPQTVLVVEFANKGSLLDLIQKQSLKLDTSTSFFTHIIKALQHAHQQSIAHRDVKLDNVLIFQKGGKLSAKLGDFGLASLCRIQGKMKRFKQIRGSESYMSPQIWQMAENSEQGYDALKVDVFALGVTLFAMVYCKMPFRRATHSDSLYNLIIQNTPEQFWKIHGIPFSLQDSPLELLQSFRTLFMSMVHADPTKRPSIDEIKGHPFLLSQV